MSLPAAAKAIAFVLTPDRPRAERFYSDVLGLTKLSEGPFAAVYDLGGGSVLRLTNIQSHMPAPHTVLGWAVPDIALAMAALQSRGVKFIVYAGMTDDNGVWTSPDGAAKVCWFEDLDGNNLSLTQS
jgi:catechol-2,3-dioxygenase